MYVVVSNKQQYFILQSSCISISYCNLSTYYVCKYLLKHEINPVRCLVSSMSNLYCVKVKGEFTQSSRTPIHPHVYSYLLVPWASLKTINLENEVLKTIFCTTWHLLSFQWLLVLAAQQHSHQVIAEIKTPPDISTHKSCILFLSQESLWKEPFWEWLMHGWSQSSMESHIIKSISL